MVRALQRARYTPGTILRNKTEETRLFRFFDEHRIGGTDWNAETATRCLAIAMTEMAERRRAGNPPGPSMAPSTAKTLLTRWKGIVTRRGWTCSIGGPETSALLGAVVFGHKSRMIPWKQQQS